MGDYQGEEVANRLSGTLKSDLTLSARLDMPLTRHVRMVSFTLCPKNAIFPSASFSSCCCVVKSRAYSSAIYVAGYEINQSGGRRVRTRASKPRSLSSEKNFWAAFTELIFEVGS